MISQSRFEPPSSRGDESREYPSIKRSIKDLTKDAVVLAELQAQLAAQEATVGIRRWIAPLIAILVAIITGLGTVPVVLMTLAEVLVDQAEWERPLAFAASTGIGLLAAIVIGLIGWFTFKSRLTIFERTICELKHNVAWLKAVTGAR